MIDKHDNIRVIDFGLSAINRHNKRLDTVAGTPLYMAPEVIKGSYGKEADIWSLGVLLYMLVSGYFPFQAHGNAALFNKIKECEWNFDHKVRELLASNKYILLL